MKLRLLAGLFLASALLCAQGTPQMPLGVYNTSAPTLSNGNYNPLRVDVSGNLLVNVASGSTGNAAASATGSAVPAQAGYCGVNVAGTLRGCTAVNPSGSIYAQQIDIASAVGTTLDVNSGVKSAGTIRVVLATDQPQLTNKLLVTPDANSAINVAQINGVTPLMGNGVTGTGSQRVTIASDNTAFAVNATAQASTNWIGYTQPKNACGTTSYDPAMQFLPSASTQLTASDTCVTAVFFNNTDTVNHTVSVQDQSTGCNTGVCNVFSTFTIPPSGMMRMPFDGIKFIGGVKWNADVANKVVAGLKGNQ